MKNDKMKFQYRVNEQIHAREVRVVSEGNAEVMSTRQALDIARKEGVDLVEISPNAQPPVCRIIDYSKFLYQQKKHQKEMKQKQVKQDIKEIRFGPQTDEHDYQFKLKHAQEFLNEGNKVRAYVFFRGRSILFKEQGEVLLLRFANDLEELAKVDEELEHVELKDELTDIMCEKCGKPMTIKYGRYGKFLACSGYPECKNVKPFVEKAANPCPVCGAEVYVRKTKRGRNYYICSNNHLSEI